MNVQHIQLDLKLINAYSAPVGNPSEGAIQLHKENGGKRQKFIFNHGKKGVHSIDMWIINMIKEKVLMPNCWNLFRADLEGIRATIASKSIQGGQFLRSGEGNLS